MSGRKGLNSAGSHCLALTRSVGHDGHRALTAVIFVILTSAMALIFSVLGLATTHQVRFDMKDKFRREGAQQQAAISKPNEWAALRDEFNATVRERADTIEDLLDEQFRRRFSELMFRSARARHRNRVAALP